MHISEFFFLLKAREVEAVNVARSVIVETVGSHPFLSRPLFAFIFAGRRGSRGSAAGPHALSERSLVVGLDPPPPPRSTASSLRPCCPQTAGLQAPDAHPDRDSEHSFGATSGGGVIEAVPEGASMPGEAGPGALSACLALLRRDDVVDIFCEVRAPLPLLCSAGGLPWRSWPHVCARLGMESGRSQAPRACIPTTLSLFSPQIEQWNFNAFLLAERTDGHPLATLGYMLFEVRKGGGG